MTPSDSVVNSTSARILNETPSVRAADASGISVVPLNGLAIARGSCHDISWRVSGDTTVIRTKLYKGRSRTRTDSGWSTLRTWQCAPSERPVLICHLNVARELNGYCPG